jgi:hypothetical protein
MFLKASFWILSQEESVVWLNIGFLIREHVKIPLELDDLSNKKISTVF